MELKQNKNKIKVTGNDIYLDPNDNSILLGSYKWEDSITIDIFVGLDHNSEINEIKYSVNDHSNTDDFNILEASKDGLYKIIHYVIPTLEWADRSSLNDFIYYHDDKLYHRNNTDEEIGIGDLLESNVNSVENDTFITYFIKRCFIEISKKILAAQCESRELLSLKEQQELVWVFINIIKYSIEFGNIFEAQLYIEEFFKCNTICNKPISSILNYDCKCK